MQNNFAIGGRLENRAFALELVAQNICVNQIAIVGDRHLAADAIDHERLRVFDRAGAGGGIPGMANRATSFELFQFRLPEDLWDKPHVFVNQERSARAVAGHNSSALLPAMLEGEKTIVGQNGCVGMTEHAKKSALVLRVNVSRLEVVGVVRRGHKK